VGAGDGIDNDCDGLVDEETNFNTGKIGILTHVKFEFEVFNTW